MWHKGIITRLDRDKLEGHLTTIDSSGLHNDQRVFFIFAKEQFDLFMKAFVKDVKVDLYVEEPHSYARIMKIDGKYNYFLKEDQKI